MPIKGVSERRRLPRLGKIRLGVKVEPEGRASYPRPVDHFVCPPEVQQALGQEKPKDLTIVFPHDDPEQWSSHFYRAYSSYQGLVCKGDGETAVRTVDMERAVDSDGALPDERHPKHWPIARRDTTKTAYQEIECPGARSENPCPQFQAKQCRPVMNLQFMLPQVPGIGVWQLDTSSWNSIRNVLDGIELIKSITGGTIGMIPLRLSVVPLVVQPREGDTPQPKKTVWVLRLTSPEYLGRFLQLGELPRGQALILPAPDDEPADDLYPEEEPTESPVEETLDSFEAPAEAKPPQDLDQLFPQHEDREERQATWDGIRNLIEDGAATKNEAAQWLAREEEVSVALKSFDSAEPPKGIATKALTRLHDALGQRQLRLEGSKPPEYAG